MSFRPPEYCSSCLHNGTAVCELPSRLEIAGKVAKSAVAATFDAASYSVDMFVFARPPADVGNLQGVKDAYAGIYSRVNKCVEFHRAEDENRDPGI